MQEKIYRSRDLAIQAIDAMEEIYMHECDLDSPSAQVASEDRSSVHRIRQQLVRIDSAMEYTTRRFLRRCVWEMGIEQRRRVVWWVRPERATVSTIAMVFDAMRVKLDRLIDCCLTDKDFSALTSGFGRFSHAKMEIAVVADESDFSHVAESARMKRRKGLVICDFPLTGTECDALAGHGLNVLFPAIRIGGDRLCGVPENGGAAE